MWGLSHRRVNQTSEKEGLGSPTQQLEGQDVSNLANLRCLRVSFSYSPMNLAFCF